MLVTETGAPFPQHVHSCLAEGGFEEDSAKALDTVSPR